MNSSALPEQAWSRLFKIVFLGDAGVGKTNLIRVFAHHRFDGSVCSTIGVDLVPCTQWVDGEYCRFHLWDTAGQERFQSLTRTHYRGVHGIVLVFDVTNRESFHRIPYWVNQVKEQNDRFDDLPVLLIGAKLDRADESRQVSQEEARELAMTWKNAKYEEVSARTELNVQNAMIQFMEKVYRVFLEKEEESNAATSAAAVVTSLAPTTTTTTGKNRRVVAADSFRLRRRDHGRRKPPCCM